METEITFLSQPVMGRAKSPNRVRVKPSTEKGARCHNLWPFEVVIALMVGLAGAVPGALIGSAIRRWR